MNKYHHEDFIYNSKKWCFICNKTINPYTKFGGHNTFSTLCSYYDILCHSRINKIDIVIKKSLENEILIENKVGEHIGKLNYKKLYRKLIIYDFKFEIDINLEDLFIKLKEFFKVKEVVNKNITIPKYLLELKELFNYNYESEYDYDSGLEFM